MKKSVAFIIAIVFGMSVFAQTPIKPNVYVIKFKDKNNNGFSVQKPEEFLSKRAIERRNKYKIPVTVQDLPVNSSYVKQVKDLGFEIYAVSKWLNLAVVFSEDSTLYQKALALNFVEPYNTIPTASDKKSKPEKFKKLKVSETKGKKDVFDYGKGDNQAEMLKVNVLHSLGYSGQGMQIAVLDAGFYHANTLPSFEKLFENKQILGIKDFVARDGEVYEDDTHGMMVLSCIGGNLPGELVGTAPDAEFYLIRTEDEATEYIVEEYYWVAGAEYADSLGVDMIHSSLGYNDFEDKIHSHKYADMNGNTTPITIGADIAASKGILVVTSAGNEGNDAWKYISAPADGDSVLSVGSVTAIGSISGFSSRGPSSDGRVKPDGMAQGSFAKVQSANGKITSSFGTSFSGPILAGAVACLWQANPEFTNMQIIDALHRTASLALEPNGDYGFGIPNIALADAYLKSLKK